MTERTVTGSRVGTRTRRGGEDPRYPLELRARRSARHALDGNPTILIVTEAEVERAKTLIGDAPVVVATSFSFMRWLTAQGERKARRKRA